MNATSKIEVPRGVYAKIAAVQGELAKVGIAKSRRNAQQGYNFRGIDEVYAALSPLLSAHGLVIVPRVLEREVVERSTHKGTALFNVTVRAEFDFISADDGSIHTAATFGEAMDSADKATNKAMSAAYKYAAFMTFAIPTEGDNDADAVTHEVASRPAGGHSDERAVSPPASQQEPQRWSEPDSIYSGISKLKTGLKQHMHDLEGCDDSASVYALCSTSEWREFARVAEKHAPHYLRGGDPAPPEFEGLLTKAERMVAEFDTAEANNRAALART